LGEPDTPEAGIGPFEILQCRGLPPSSALAWRRAGRR